MVNCQFMSSKSTYANVLARYFVIRLTARLCTKHGLFKERAHWCMAIDIYGRVDPKRQPNIPTSDL